VLEPSNTLILKRNNQHGIVFIKQNLDGYSSYIEFKVNIEKKYKSLTQLFIGLVDKSKYKIGQLSSKYWRDSPSSFYWNVWEKQLSKTDEYGIQINCSKGYGCSCEDCETFLGMKYDHISRSINFYKNGINLGVAFRNVPSGLTPSLDLWFEVGSVEIIQNASCEEKNFL
jgi:hypothetical protein